MPDYRISNTGISWRVVRVIDNEEYFVTSFGSHPSRCPEAAARDYAAWSNRSHAGQGEAGRSGNLTQALPLAR